MAKLTPAHLPPLMQAFAAALRDGTLPLATALDFCVEIEWIALDECVRQNYAKFLHTTPPKPVTSLGDTLPPPPPPPPSSGA